MLRKPVSRKPVPVVSGDSPQRNPRNFDTTEFKSGNLNFSPARDLKQVPLIHEPTNQIEIQDPQQEEEDGGGVYSEISVTNPPMTATRAFEMQPTAWHKKQIQDLAEAYAGEKIKRLEAEIKNLRRTISRLSGETPTASALALFSRPTNFRLPEDSYDWNAILESTLDDSLGDVNSLTGQTYTALAGAFMLENLIAANSKEVLIGGAMENAEEQEDTVTLINLGTAMAGGIIADIADGLHARLRGRLNEIAAAALFTIEFRAPGVLIAEASDHDEDEGSLRFISWLAGALAGIAETGAYPEDFVERANGSEQIKEQVDIIITACLKLLRANEVVVNERRPEEQQEERDIGIYGERLRSFIFTALEGGDPGDNSDLSVFLEVVALWPLFIIMAWGGEKNFIDGVSTACAAVLYAELGVAGEQMARSLWVKPEGEEEEGAPDVAPWLAWIYGRVAGMVSSYQPPYETPDQIPLGGYIYTMAEYNFEEFSDFTSEIVSLLVSSSEDLQPLVPDAIGDTLGGSLLTLWMNLPALLETFDVNDNPIQEMDGPVERFAHFMAALDLAAAE